ncbi:MAG: mandelate racemase/muconate lactonizing enzyme family protein [Chloroflexi bacterium]|nr:mandelate racemase/muconate lactonizing enzyme family protein [Chloroflexota bacterium]
MKITGIKTFIVGNPPPHRGGRNFVFLKLTTDEGLVGYGECNMAHQREHAVAKLAQDLGAAHVIGMDPFNTEQLWETLYSSVHFYRHPGIMSTQVVAAFDMAFWDIIGKALNQPIYNLLGGKVRDKVRAYSYMYAWRQPQPPEMAAEGAAEMVEKGYTALKFDPLRLPPCPRDISLEELRYAESIVRAVREAVGTKADILIGTHGQLNTHSALRFARMLEPYDPLWFEEPVPPENLDEMARVAEHTNIPIATGERLCTLHDFHALLKKQAAQIVQAHVGLNGILGLKKIAGMCEANYAQNAPWLYCGPIAGAANVQLDVCMPSFLIQEGIQEWGGFHAEILKEPMRWEQGYIIPPDKPGLGVELNEEVAEAHPYLPPTAP